MVRCMRIVKAVRTLAHRKRIEPMRRGMEKIEIDVNDKNTRFDCLVNHVIKINSYIQAIVWEGGLLSNIKEY